jgi:hypothetical protein
MRDRVSHPYSTTGKITVLYKSNRRLEELHNEGLHNLYSSSNITGAIKKAK